MTIRVFCIYKRVIIDEILITRIIRRIDVDDINLSLMGIAEGSEGFKVITLNDYMIRGISLIA